MKYKEFDCSWLELIDTIYEMHENEEIDYFENINTATLERVIKRTVEEAAKENTKIEREEILKLLATAKNDIDFWESPTNLNISVITNDVEGFTEDWKPVYRDYDKKLVTSIQEKLEKLANTVDYKSFYTHYYFDGFEVEWGYASYEH